MKISNEISMQDDVSIILWATSGRERGRGEKEKGRRDEGVG